MENIYIYIIIAVVIGVIAYVIYTKTATNKSASNEAVTAETEKEKWIREKIAWLMAPAQIASKAWDIQAKADERGETYKQAVIRNVNYYAENNKVW